MFRLFHYRLRSTADVYAACKTLGVPSTATLAEIKEIYKKKVAICHPDVQGGSDTEMKVLNAAYELLKKNPPLEALHENTASSSATAHRHAPKKPAPFMNPMADNTWAQYNPKHFGPIPSNHKEEPENIDDDDDFLAVPTGRVKPAAAAAADAVPKQPPNPNNKPKKRPKTPLEKPLDIPQWSANEKAAFEAMQREGQSVKFMAQRLHKRDEEVARYMQATATGKTYSPPPLTPEDRRKMRERSMGKVLGMEEGEAFHSSSAGMGAMQMPFWRPT